MVVSPESAVNNMKLCTVPYNYNWIQRYRFNLVENFLPRTTAQQNLLDFGCGNGLFMEHLLSHNHSLSMTGYDPYYPNNENNTLDRGMQIFKSLDSISCKKFDIVCALEVIEHIENDVDALLQISSLLKPQGTLLLTVPSYQILYSYCDAAVGHYRRYTRSSLIQNLEKTGFSVYHSTYFFSFLIPFAFALKHWLQVRRIWSKDQVLDLPIDPMSIFFYVGKY